MKGYAATTILFLTLGSICTDGSDPRISVISTNSEMDIQQENMIMEGVINRTIENVKQQIAEYDPISFGSFSVNRSLIALEVSALKVSGFSDFVAKSLSYSLIRRTLNMSMLFSQTKVSTGNVALSLLQRPVFSVKGGVSVKSLLIDASANTTLSTIYSLTLIPSVETITLSIEGTFLGKTVTLQRNLNVLVEIINTYGPQMSDTLSEIVLFIIRAVLGTS